MTNSPGQDDPEMLIEEHVFPELFHLYNITSIANLAELVIFFLSFLYSRYKIPLKG